MPASSVCLLTSSPAATAVVAATVARACRPGDVVVLAGEMGAGKTAFAKGFGAALGVTEPITSPTFTLVQTYDARWPGGSQWPGDAAWSGRPLQLHHADVYRLDQLSEVADLAFGELAEFGGVLLVEWGDVVAATLGDHLLVQLEAVDDTDEDPDNDSVDGAVATTSALLTGDAAAPGTRAGAAEMAGDVVDAAAADELAGSSRRITVVPVGRAWASRWERLRRELIADGEGVRTC